MVLIENHGLVLALHIFYCSYVFVLLLLPLYFIIVFCVLCFLLFVVYNDDYVILQLFGSSLVAQLSFFLFDFPFTFLLLNIHFAFNCPFILTHISLFCYRPIVQLGFFFSSKHHACTLALL